MSEIEEFEKWLANSGISYRRDIALGSWQACAELKDKRIAELEAKLVEQAKVLVANVSMQLELEEQIRVAKDWANHNTQQTIDLVCENIALKAEFAESQKQEPVAYMCKTGGLAYTKDSFSPSSKLKLSPLFVAPVIPDTALQKALLEARIDELENCVVDLDIQVRIDELRAQLAALNKGESIESEKEDVCEPCPVCFIRECNGECLGE